MHTPVCISFMNIEYDKNTYMSQLVKPTFMCIFLTVIVANKLQLTTGNLECSWIAM